MEDLIEKLEKLELKPGDILVVTVKPNIFVDAERMMERISNLPGFPEGVLIFLTDDRIKLDRLTDDMMNRFGWYKRETEDEPDDPS